MNKFIGLLIVILISTGVTAQVYIGGEVSYAKGKTGENKEKLTSVLIAPEIGYKLNEKWTVGTSVRLESVEKGYSNETSYAIAPYVRYNIVKMGAITLFSDAALGFAMGALVVFVWSKFKIKRIQAECNAKISEARTTLDRMIAVMAKE